MARVVFIILHYQNIDDTVNCIESIKELDNLQDNSFNIIVVDNKSPNGTGELLKDKYINEKEIETILLEKNYGFSKANNIAFETSKKYNPDIVMVLNNDIIFEEVTFLDKLKNIYNSSEQYDIVCPDIININGNHQNPLRDKEMSLKKAYKNMIYESIFAAIMNIPGIRKLILEKRNKREEKWFKTYYNKRAEVNINSFVPFGAFIIYMNKWLKNENKAFVSDTFMYCEEDMLSLYIKQKKYKTLYADELKVRHLEGQSTKKSNKNEYQTMKFKSKNKAKALRKYIKFYKDIRRKGK